MINSKLQYMMSNNPEKTLTEKSDKIRKKIRPYFYNFLKLGNKLKLITDKKEIVKTERPIIYVASHGFKDDVLNTVLTVKDNAYIVFGNIDLFFNTFDGLCLWIYGVQLVDRYNEESKHAMKDKMNRIIKLGNNVIIFAEATWNLSPNKLMENLHGGFYDVAKKNNALIVPVLTHKVGKNCYSRILKEIDLFDLSNEDIETIKLKLIKYINKADDILLYNTILSRNIKEYVYKLKIMINELEKCKSINDLTKWINEIEEKAKNYSEIINKLTSDNIYELDTIKRANMIISRISIIRKEVMVSKVRNIMALEKYDMLFKYPDYSYMKNGKDMYEAWNDYLEETIKATPYFYLEPEQTTLYRDALIQDEIEVMPWLKRYNDSKQYYKK